MSDIIITPNRGSTNAPTIQFSGSVNASASIRLEVLPEGQVAFLGKSGSLFSISDNMVGSLMAVSDISGLPILEVFSDDKVVMGKFNANTLIVTGSRIAIGKAIPTSNAILDISGSVVITGSLTSSLDANIATITVGRGKGSIAENTAVGYQPLYNNTTGNFNTALGYQALLNNTYGFQNTALGSSTLAINVSGSYNTAISQGALNNNKSGSFNIAIGVSALSTNIGADSNIAIGHQSLTLNNTGDSNIGIGKSALLSNVGGRASVAVGSSALTNSTGDKCIGIGHSAGSSITSGVNNIVIGNSTTGITTGANNIIIGNNVTGLSTSLANTIIIADGAGNIRQYIDSSGNIGVGTTSPSNKLHVYSTNTGTTSNGNEQFLIIENSVNGTTGLYGIGFKSQGGFVQAGIFAFNKTNSGANGDLRFYTRNTASSFQENMRISDEGNVGIGTTIPNAKLDINGNTIITGSLTVTGNITGTIVAAAPDFSPIFMMMGA